MPALALYGSGEFLPWSRAVDDWCLERARRDSDRVVILPTASAPEGDDVFGRWASMGIAHYQRMGMRPHALDVRTRADAERPDLAAEIGDARLIFFSGGNPGYLAETMRDTVVWRAVRDAVAGGAALAGCSAGSVFLGARAPFVQGEMLDRWVPGVGLLADAFVLPHFDMLDSYVPGLRARMLHETPEGTTVVGIDENTALCGDGERWRVIGDHAVWIGEGDDLREYRDGDDVVVRLGLVLP